MSRHTVSYAAVVQGADAPTECRTRSDRLNVANLNCHSVAWMFKHIGGIQPDPENPGFKNIIIKPQIGGGISCASMHYDTTHGRVTTHWYIQEVEEGPNVFHLKATIPVNTTAELHIIGEDYTTIYEGEQDINLAYLSEGVILTDEYSENNKCVFHLDSGDYHFRSVSEHLFPFSCEDSCGELCLGCVAEDGSRPCDICNPSCNPNVEE